MKNSPEYQSQALKKFEVFFETDIAPTQFATKMRRFMNAAITYYLNDDDLSYQNEIREGFHYLTKFVEQIVPVLECEESNLRIIDEDFRKTRS